MRVCSFLSVPRGCGECRRRSSPGARLIDSLGPWSRSWPCQLLFAVGTLGRRNLTLHNILKLAAALEIDPGELVRGIAPVAQ